MPKFIPYNYLDQLRPGTFEYAIHFLFEHKLDLSHFYPEFNNDHNGRPAYDPAILLKIILFAYSKGITSSRDIEWSCQNNIIFKALSCDAIPHYTTIANFVSGYTEQIETLFEQILLICDKEGLLGHELFAIDGCKMSSNAAKEHSGTFKELEQKRQKIKKQIAYHLAEHKNCDKSMPRDQERIKRHQQAQDTLSKAYDKIDRFLKTASPRMGKGRRIKEVKSNITDNVPQGILSGCAIHLKSAKMTTSKGTIQGYNGVASVDNKHQIIIDAQAFGEGQEHHTLQPVLETIKD